MKRKIANRIADFFSTLPDDNGRSGLLILSISISYKSLTILPNAQTIKPIIPARINCGEYVNSFAIKEPTNTDTNVIAQLIGRIIVI